MLLAWLSIGIMITILFLENIQSGYADAQNERASGCCSGWSASVRETMQW